MKKRVLAALLTGAMCMSLLAGCGSSASTDTTETADATTDETSDADTTTDETAEETEIQVFIAASLSTAMEEVAEAFNEEHPEVKITYNADSSGTLLTQIEEGYACDVFFSAAQKQMDTLENEDGLVVEGTRGNVLNNQVVVAVSNEATTDCTGIETLDKAESLAIADGSVPVGKYTRKALISLGILDETDTPEEYTTDQLSEALGGIEISEQGNVSKVLSAIIENPGQVGTIYYSDTYGYEDQLTILETVSYDLTGDIIYPVAQIQNSEADDAETAAAAEFVEFIKGDTAKAIFDKYYFDTENIE